MNPISEAPKDGTWIIGIHVNPVVPYSQIIKWDGRGWYGGNNYYEPTHFLPYNPPKPKRKIKLRGHVYISDTGDIIPSAVVRIAGKANMGGLFALVDLEKHNIEVEEGEGITS